MARSPGWHTGDQSQYGSKKTKVEAKSYVVRVRIKSGLSQSEFATALGVSKRTLEQWEQGQRKPSGAATIRICSSSQLCHPPSIPVLPYAPSPVPAISYQLPCILAIRDLLLSLTL